MKCKHCRKEIEFNGQYYHKHNDSIYCYPDEVAKPVELSGPGEWVTGQHWVDAGGSWDEFVAAHKSDPKAEWYDGVCWKKCNLLSYSCDYTASKESYRLRLNDKGELPKAEESESCTALEAEVESWEEKVICANCKKAVSKAAIEEIYYFCSEDCAREGAAKLLDTEYVKIRKKREVPLVNPLCIPLGWWVAMDKDGAWVTYSSKPVRVDESWGCEGYYPLECGVDWQGDWKDSLFSRAEILERWKQEYGDSWLDIADGEDEARK